MRRQRHFRTNLFKRALAMLVDYLPLLLAAVFICKEFYNIAPYPVFDSTVSLTDQAASLHAFIVSMLLVTLIWFTYGTLAEASPLRATFGKRLFGLRVSGITGAPLTFTKAFVRNFSKFVSVLPLGLGFLWAIVSLNNRAWHDILAEAVVEERD